MCLGNTKVVKTIIQLCPGVSFSSWIHWKICDNKPNTKKSMCVDQYGHALRWLSARSSCVPYFIRILLLLLLLCIVAVVEKQSILFLCLLRRYNSKCLVIILCILCSHLFVFVFVIFVHGHDVLRCVTDSVDIERNSKSGARTQNSNLNAWHNEKCSGFSWMAQNVQYLLTLLTN